MTIAIGWVRTISDCEELVIMTDSRLSGDGRVFDAAPKILTLSRGDCAIAFAGSTQDAFPMMLQLSLAIGSHTPSKRRSLDITQLKTHALKIFNTMGSMIKSDVHVQGMPPDGLPAAEFLFGGYSWIKKRFELWNIRYDRSQNSYVANSAPWAYLQPNQHGLGIRSIRRPDRSKVLGQIAFAGDQAPVAEANLIKHFNSLTNIPAKIDMEPFDIIVQMLRDPNRSHTIDGAPQIAKVYQFLKAVQFPIYWPDKLTGTRYLQGRPCLGYEKIDTKVFDPDLPAW